MKPATNADLGDLSDIVFLKTALQATVDLSYLMTLSWRKSLRVGGGPVISSVLRCFQEPGSN